MVEVLYFGALNQKYSIFLFFLTILIKIIV